MSLAPNSSLGKSTITTWVTALLSAGLAAIVVTKLTVTTTVIPEGTAPTGTSSNANIYMDSADHLLKAKVHGDTAQGVVLSGTANAFTVTNDFKYGDSLTWTVPDGHKFQIAGGDTTFNGIPDHILNFGYNVKNGGQIDATEPMFYQSLEGDYYDAVTHWIEWHLNYVGVGMAGGTRRPMALSVDRGLHTFAWVQRGEDFQYLSSTGANVWFKLDFSGGTNPAALILSPAVGAPNLKLKKFPLQTANFLTMTDSADTLVAEITASGTLNMAQAVGHGLSLGSATPTGPHIRIDSSDNTVVDSGTVTAGSALFLQFDSGHEIYTGTGTQMAVGATAMIGAERLRVAGALRAEAASVIDGSADAVQLIVQGHSTQTSNVFEVQNSAATPVVYVTNAGAMYSASSISASVFTVGGGGQIKTDGIRVPNGDQFSFSPDGTEWNTPDAGFIRNGVGIIKTTNGSTGMGDLQTGAILTAATMTVASNAFVRSAVTKATWTNAQVVALGAVTAGDISVCTLPAKTRVKNVYVIIDSQAAGTTTLTVAVGRTSATYIDYIVASDAKVAVNTIYGDAVGERGTNLTGYDLPSYTATTTVYAHFISTVENLDQATTCTGTVVLETETLP